MLKFRREEISNSDQNRRRCSLCGGTAIKLNTLNLLGLIESESFGCQKCGSLFRYPLPDPAALSTYYDGNSERYPPRVQKRMAFDQVRWLRHALRQAGAPECLSFLEYGAGQGWLVSAVLKTHLSDHSTGIEADAGAVEWGRENLGANLLQGFVGSDIALQEEWSPEPSIVAMVHVLEHLHEPQATLASIRQRHPKAMLFLEVPNGLHEIPVIQRDIFPWSSMGQHLWSFSDVGLKCILESSGFRTVLLQSVGNGNFWKSRLRSLDVARLYQKLFRDWETNGGGIRDIVTKSATVLIHGLSTGVRNSLGRVSRTQLPSLRVLARPI